MCRPFAPALDAPTPVTDPIQRGDPGAWHRTISKVAREEMGHLMTVRDLGLLLGITPSFWREYYPIS